MTPTQNYNRHEVQPRPAGQNHTVTHRVFITPSNFTRYALEDGVNPAHYNSEEALIKALNEATPSNVTYTSEAQDFAETLDFIKAYQKDLKARTDALLAHYYPNN